MGLQTLATSPLPPIRARLPLSRLAPSSLPPRIRRFRAPCLGHAHEYAAQSPSSSISFDGACDLGIDGVDDVRVPLVESDSQGEVFAPDSGDPGTSLEEPGDGGAGAVPHIWRQMKEIAVFAGPAVGLWICGPLMSLIDTAVIGQGSSLELAALGPSTVVCDYLSYVFMFLSIATSNMVATSLAKNDKGEVQHQISMLLFVALTCGMGMLFFTKFMGTSILTAFVGPENLHIVPAASSYVQIRGLAWPAVLVGMVAQSASLGMKDSWGPLKALAVASIVNGFGDILLCNVFGLGIAGAAWATMVSQVIAAFMMIETLNRTGFKLFL
ncbi:hypothetical protein QJS10_CPA01g02297 [Acorus calamus]|uniref:Protein DETOXIFICATION n=1 Tax=Acorus calamus TaxID=4465 RepID=A0AAV9FID1_ACOCL|nr:hypothetical protein QJS10_CPA01g02297 [Acorus calamus]